MEIKKVTELPFVQTQFNSGPTEGIEMSDELITEQTGYRSTKEIVEGMIMAGQRIEAYRHGKLDNLAEDYEDEPIERYEKDLVDEQEIIERKLRYRSEKCRDEVEAKEGEVVAEPTVKEPAGTTEPVPAQSGMAQGV